MNKVNFIGAITFVRKKDFLSNEKQAGNYPAHHGTFMTEGLRGDPR